jgi:hypothetical protein
VTRAVTISRLVVAISLLLTMFVVPSREQTAEQRLRGGHVAMFAEDHVDQRARAINGTYR